MKILAIDPGSEFSAVVLFDGSKILDHFIYMNQDVGDVIEGCDADILAVEMVASYGMPVGATIFETCVWVGRFIERWFTTQVELPYMQIYRKDVKMHLCQSMRAKDSNIIQALKDRFGDYTYGKTGKGTKKNPAMLYGVHDDEWQALAVAVYVYDTFNK